MTKTAELLKLARPHHYVKNGFIWLPLFFGYKLHDLQSVLHTFYAFLVFSLVASSIYILNDIFDIEEDRMHPMKQHRPLASGRIAKREAVLFFILLFIVSAVLSVLLLPSSILLLLLGYFVLNIAYTIYLKHFAIIDINCIAVGFILRVLAGGISADVPISRWILIMSFLLALFLALAKRRDDLMVLSASGNRTRESIDGYNLEFVSLSMMVMASVIIVSYILYTVSPEVTEKHHTHKLYLTGFWVVLGLLRYVQITVVDNRSGSPTRVMLRDPFLQITILLWLISYYVLLYFAKQ